MRKQLWMLIVVFLALLVGCTEVSEDNGDEDYNQSSGTSTSYTVHFCTNSIADWDSVYVYAWNGSDSNAEWPGKLMSSESGGWYSATVSYSNVIFNDGSSNQTEDLTAQNGYFLPQSKSAGKVSGTWYTSKPANTDVGGGSNNNNGNNSNSNTGSTTLSAPTGVSATYISSSNEIEVTWNSVSNATSYEFYWGTSSDSSKAIKSTKTITSTTHGLTGVEEGDSFYFWIKAKNSSTTSSFSSYAYCFVPYTLPSRPSAPTGLKATATSSSSISLSWNSVSGADEYMIYYNTSSSSSTAEAIAYTSGTSKTITGLEANTKYYFWVKAITSDYDSSDFSSYAYVTTESVKVTGGKLKIINNSSHTIKNLTLYTSNYDLWTLSGIESVICTVYFGYSQTVENVLPGIYVEIGSQTYAGYKIDTYKEVIIQSGQTATLIIDDDDIISN